MTRALVGGIALALAGCLVPVQPSGPQPSGGGQYYGGQPLGGTGTSSSPGTTSPSTSPTTPPSPPPRNPPMAGPVVVPVTIHSDCSHTVPVFFGEKPGFGSGTKSSIDGNSSESHSFRPGEMLWIIDDSEHGLTSVTVTAGAHEIDITAACTAFSMH